MQGDKARAVTFTLTAALVRGGGELQTFRLPGKVETVRLVAPLSKPSYAAYLATIRTPEGETAWKGDAPRPEPNAHTLTVTVPAPVLAPGDYILTVTGISASGHEEPVIDAAFRIQRP